MNFKLTSRLFLHYRRNIHKKIYEIKNFSSFRVFFRIIWDDFFFFVNSVRDRIQNSSDLYIRISFHVDSREMRNYEIIWCEIWSTSPKFQQKSHWNSLIRWNFGKVNKNHNFFRIIISELFTVKNKKCVENVHFIEKFSSHAFFFSPFYLLKFSIPNDLMEK